MKPWKNWNKHFGQLLRTGWNSSSCIGLRKSGLAPSSTILKTRQRGRRLGACRVASGGRTALTHFSFFRYWVTFALRLIFGCSLLFWTLKISLHRSHTAHPCLESSSVPKHTPYFLSLPLFSAFWSPDTSFVFNSLAAAFFAFSSFSSSAATTSFLILFSKI